MDGLIAFLALRPGLIWACIGLFVVVLYRPFREEVLPRLTGLQLMGLRMDLKAEDVQRAVEAVPKPGITYPSNVGQDLLS